MCWAQQVSKKLNLPLDVTINNPLLPSRSSKHPHKLCAIVPSLGCWSSSLKTLNSNFLMNFRNSLYVFLVRNLVKSIIICIRDWSFSTKLHLINPHFFPMDLPLIKSSINYIVSGPIRPHKTWSDDLPKMCQKPVHVRGTHFDLLCKDLLCIHNGGLLKRNASYITTGL